MLIKIFNNLRSNIFCANKIIANILSRVELGTFSCYLPVKHWKVFFEEIYELKDSKILYLLRMIHILNNHFEQSINLKH